MPTTPLTLLVGILVYTISAFGLAYIVGHSRISRPVRLALHDTGGWWTRTIVELVECPACFGFWTGLAVGSYLALAHHAPFGVPFGVACYTTGANFLLGRVTGLIPSPDVDF